MPIWDVPVPRFCYHPVCAFAKLRTPMQPTRRFLLTRLVGLPWAAFAGSFAARNVLSQADEDYKKYYPYFSNRRHFSLPFGLANIAREPAHDSLKATEGTP